MNASLKIQRARKKRHPEACGPKDFL